MEVPEPENPAAKPPTIEDKAPDGTPLVATTPPISPGGEALSPAPADGEATAAPGNVSMFRKAGNVIMTSLRGMVFNFYIILFTRCF